MALLVSYLLVGLSVLTVGLGLFTTRTEGGQLSKRALRVVIFGSAAWSMGLGVMTLHTMDQLFVAWLCRSFGIIGMTVYLTGVIWLISDLSGLTGARLWFYRIVPFLSVLVLPFNLKRNGVHFYQAGFGLTYSFANGLGSDLYSIYYIIYAILLTRLVIHIYRNAETRFQRKVANRLILALGITVFGMVFDTVLPVFGLPAFPGSPIGQAIGAFVLLNAYRYGCQNSINTENLSRYIYDIVQEPILVSDKKGSCQLLNRSGQEFFGSDKVEKGMPVEELFDMPENWQGNNTRLEATCKMNRKICDLCIDQVKDQYGDCIGYIFVVNDMTERIQTMKNMEIAKEQAEVANKSKSRFLANMSHEIRTPINTVLGMDEMILRETEDKTIKEYAKEIRSSGKSLLSIVNEILDFSKIESGKMELVEGNYDTAPFFSDITRVMRFRAETKALQLALDVQEDLPSKLFGDEMRIRQIVSNFLTNAVKYTEKGSICLRVNWSQDDTAEDVGLLHIQVKDTGHGMTKEQMEVVFDSFQRLDESAVHKIEGTGLGLSIVKGLVEMMGGRVWVESEVDVGSVFHCEFPQKVVCATPVGKVSVEEFENREVEENQLSFIAPGASILAVDDNKVNLRVLAGLLKRTQVKVDLAVSGKQALKMAAKKQYDIIFLDHMMPEMDGIETLNRLKTMEENASRDAVVIVLTANAIVGMKEQYLQEGFRDYLSKPIDTGEMESMIMKYLPQELVQRM